MEQNLIDKKILYIDMDGVVADFEKGIKQHFPEWDKDRDGDKTDEICGSVNNFFLDLHPINGSIDAINKLASKYETYFLSAAMWNVPQSFTEKRLWIEKHFGSSFRKRLILTHRKDLNMRDYLIDDRVTHGAGEFKGKHIHFGKEEFPDWESVENFLL